MTLPAELRAEAGRLESYSHHPDETRALLHRAADALDAVTIGKVYFCGADSLGGTHYFATRDEFDAFISTGRGSGTIASYRWQGEIEVGAHNLVHVLNGDIDGCTEILTPLPATPEGDNNSTNDEERV